MSILREEESTGDLGWELIKVELQPAQVSLLMIL